MAEAKHQQVEREETTRSNSLPSPSQREGSPPSPPPGGVGTLARGEGIGKNSLLTIKTRNYQRGHWGDVTIKHPSLWEGLVRLYEKGNLEIHSSDRGGDTDRYRDNPRRSKLYVGTYL